MRGERRARRFGLDDPVEEAPNMARPEENEGRHDEEGFTLIELMVVVLIIAILIAIAIPTFLGARERAQNRSAQSNVRNALTAEKTSYTDTQQYSATSATLTAIEPSLTYVTGVPAKGTHEVFVGI